MINEKNDNINIFYLPLLGFITAAITTTALSIYVLYVGYFSKITNTQIPILILWGNLAYFFGMPLGKIVGRFLKFYKNLSFAIVGISILISLSLFLMPFVRYFYELLILRIIQGTVTFYMEVFSNFYSFLYKEFNKRVLASSISISGIPGGVAIGTSVYIVSSQNPLIVYSLFAIISFLLALFYSIKLRNFRNVQMNLKNESKGTTYKMGRTWLMGFFWATIAGFNLILGVLLPPFVSSYSPSDIPLAMEIFGYTGALITIIGGILAYVLKSSQTMSKIVAISYILSFIGFIYLYFEPNGINLAIALTLINIEAIAVPFIYSVPRELYKEELVAKGTWEFALIGSSFHVWASLLLLEVGTYFDFRLSIFLLIFPPIYGAIVSLLLPKIYIKS
ncbi:MAG: hypothetical protein RAK17_01140 [Caldisphaera sp.]|nr:hypothetical protein [Caldisphaera sp.]